MKTICNLKLDIAKRDMIQEVFAKQCDDIARKISVELVEHGVAYQIPEDARAEFRCLKPDGRSCLYTAEIAEGRILVELTAQVLAVPGGVLADVVLTGENGEVLSSAGFRIQVERAALGNLTDSLEVLKRYEEQLAAIEEALAYLQDLTGLVGVSRIDVTEGADTDVIVCTGADGSTSRTEVLWVDGYPQTIKVDGREIPVGWTVTA